MTQTVCLRIPLGFRMEDKVKHVKLWEAEQILLSRKKWRYIRANRCGADAELVSRLLICPHCGRTYPANRSGRLFRRKKKPERSLAKETVHEWAELQMSMFVPECGTLEIAEPIETPEVFTCPQCNRSSCFSEHYRNVELRLENRRVHLKCALVGADELFSPIWCEARELAIRFPADEELVFDFEHGRVSVNLDSDGTTVLSKDVTDTLELLNGGAVSKALTYDKRTMRAVRRMFVSVWEKELPFSMAELTLHTLFQMTMFVGYPKEFYSCIPYVQNSFRIDESFLEEARNLQNANRIDSVYRTSALPKSKSVRRIFFQNPGLFFYLNEAEQLWDLLQDHNLFCRTLQSMRIFEILSSLHIKPGIMCFLKDYCAHQGKHRICKLLNEKWFVTLKQAIEYHCMSEKMKEELRKTWCGSVLSYPEESQLPYYSIPMQKPDETISNCEIDGYKFCWLRNSNDYLHAADSLRNCLRTWSCIGSPVVCIKQYDKILAAVEVCGNMIIQARREENEPIECDPELYSVFLKWCKRFDLHWDDDD